MPTGVLRLPAQFPFKRFMCALGHITALMWALSSDCELRLITRVATYANCLKVINSWLASTGMSPDANQGELSAYFRDDGDMLFLAFPHDGSPSDGFLCVRSLLPPAPQESEELA